MQWSIPSFMAARTPPSVAAAVGPTFISYTEIAAPGFGTNTTPRDTASISVNSGDILIAVTCIEGQASAGLEKVGVAGGGLTWLEEQYVNAANYTVVQIFSTTATSTTSFVVTFSRPTFSNLALWFGGGVLVFRSAAIGASTKTNVLSGAPTLDLVTTKAGSAIVTINGDWSSQDGTTRTWNTINSITPTAGNGLEKVYFRDTSHYTPYCAYWNDVGAIGTKTTGITSPGSQKYSIASIEIKAA